ncbi:MAG: flagellar biosynthetic protein FliO [Candidatus Hydrogenedentes bacterium]|nr:flagellar biosynthetic protein FliO [Candidatus Hydrogenedentota bacterium]
MPVLKTKPNIVFALALLALGFAAAIAQDMPANPPLPGATNVEEGFEVTTPPRVKLLPDFAAHGGAAEAPEPAEETQPTEAPEQPSEGVPLPDDPLINAVRDELDAIATGEEAAAEGGPAIEEGSDMWDVARGFAALLIVVALILGVFAGLRKFGKGSPMFAGVHLGRVIGRVGLTPRASLYFVRTGGRILLLGVTPNAISAVAEFDEASYQEFLASDQDGVSEASGSPPSKSSAKPPRTPASFMAHLKEKSEKFAQAEQKLPVEVTNEDVDEKESKAQPAVSSPSLSDEEEISSLRGDIARMQQYLKDSDE